VNHISATTIKLSQTRLKYAAFAHISKHMSDSSPTIPRKPRRKAPVITTSQDSPVMHPSKKTVPPSPGVSVMADVLLASQQAIGPLAASPGAPAIPPHADPPDTAAAPKPKRERKKTGRSKKQVSRRQQRLVNPLLDLQAVECDSCGASLEGSENSEDDECVFPSCSSFETQVTFNVCQASYGSVVCDKRFLL
jgi:hypothetical protein